MSEAMTFAMEAGDRPEKHSIFREICDLLLSVAMNTRVALDETR